MTSGHPRRHRGGHGAQAASEPFHTGYERDRGPEPPAPQGDQDQKTLPPTRRPLASSSTSPSPTQPRRGPEPETGPQRCSRSRSTSETACPTEPPTQKVGRPLVGRILEAMRRAVAMLVVLMSAALWGRRRVAGR